MTNLFVSSVSYQIYSCENKQCIVKVADSKGRKNNCYGLISLKNIQPVFEPRCEKTGLRGLRPIPTQTELYSHRRWLTFWIYV